ncbi:MAG: trigger factor, partial [Bacteroidaceae bacterium]|nr:trigger factor [Bacteroidaceae bacterium]
FDVALAPEFTVAPSANDTIPYYNIEVTEQMVNDQCMSYQQRAGKMEKVQDYQGGTDMLRGVLAELDENGSVKEGGIQVEEASLMPSYMKDEEQKAVFQNAKVNDVLVFNPNKAFAANENELSSLLKVEKAQVAEHAGDFSFQVEEITRFVASELNQEVFDQAFGVGVVTTAEEFKNKIKEQLAGSFVGDSNFRFLLDLRAYLMGQVGKLEFADELLKKIMLLNNKDKGEKFVEENYDKSIEELQWHLIKEQLVKANEIKVDDEEIKKMAESTTRAQFAQYGMFNVPADMLDNYVKDMLKKPETVENLVNRIIEEKIAEAVKAQVKLDTKTVSVEEFNKLFSKEQ